MPERIRWTPARLQEAREAVKKLGNPKAAAELSKRWGQPVSHNAIRFALRDHAKDAAPKKPCAYANRYKANRPPKCGGGRGCVVCAAKWEHRRRMDSDVEPLPNSFLMPGSTTWGRGEPDRQ